MKSRKNQDEFPKHEADWRRDELAIRILHTPHKPREESKVGKSKAAPIRLKKTANKPR